jgi:hypothetical protein
MHSSPWCSLKKYNHPMAENTEAKIWMSQFMLFLQLGCIPFSAIA